MGKRGSRGGLYLSEKEDHENVAYLASFSISHPKLPKKKRGRKQHIGPPLNSLKSGRDEYLSVCNSVVPHIGDNVEPLMQTSKKLMSKRDSEPGQVGKELRKKSTFPLSKSLKHRSGTGVSFDCSGVPFTGDISVTPLQVSKTVPSEREVNHSNRKHSRRARRRWKAKPRVSIREDDHAIPVRVAQHYFTSLDQNLKTSFLSTSRPNKELFSASFEAGESCEIPLPEKVDSVLDIQNSTKIRRSRRTRRRWKGSCYEQRMPRSSLQPQSDFGSKHLSSVRIPESGKDSEYTNEVPLPLAYKFVPSTKRAKYGLTNAAFDDSKNACILSEVNFDTPNCSDIRTYGKEINMARKQKIKCLKNEAHENHSAETASLPDSIIHKVERALRSPFRKKLLVLDLNGILCDVVFGSHGSCLPYKKVSMRSVFKRPFLDDFLTFCFERFAVGVWSSRNKNNIIGVINYVMGDSKDRLLFCWDQSKCTLTGVNTVENRHKPLVLKELIKLWDKEEASLPWEKGEYSPSNTLLVDDSPYKALCNPPYTAIFPSPYDFRDEGDSVLGPEGAIRVYLESIAMAEDVQEHVKKHSFGQEAITSKDKMWSFYKNIIDKNNSMALTCRH